MKQKVARMIIILGLLVASVMAALQVSKVWAGEPIIWKQECPRWAELRVIEGKQTRYVLCMHD